MGKEGITLLTQLPLRNLATDSGSGRAPQSATQAGSAVPVLPHFLDDNDIVKRYYANVSRTAAKVPNRFFTLSK